MSQPKRDILFLVLGCLILGIPLYWYESTHLIFFAVDWHLVFYPATKLVLQGLNPYVIGQFHNPVWALLPLIPFALLGEDMGRLALFFFGLFTFAFIGYRLKARPFALVAFLLSPLVFYYLFLGNIDSLVLWGLLMPAPIGLFLVVIKPQIGIAIAVYWGYVAWRAGGWRKVILTFLPVATALALSFLVFGNWAADQTDHLVSAKWNTSMFPWSLPVGVLLIFVALRSGKIQTSMAASPFLSPYVGLGSWAFSLMGLLNNNLMMFAAVFGLWLLYILAPHFLTLPY